MTQPIMTAVDYHRVTSYQRHGLTPHLLDWAHQPLLTKTYGQLDRVPLDSVEGLPEIDYMDVVKPARAAGNRAAKPLNLRKLSTVFRLTHAVTARSVQGGRPFYYRSVASAGALYPFELYLAVHRVDGLDPGVYYYDLFDFSLIVLRRGPIPELPLVDRGVAASVYISGIFFRSAWKYRNRAYRYVLLDTGHLLENLRLALNAMALSFSIHLDFDDEGIGNLLGLDLQREACLACVHLTDSAGKSDGPGGAIALRPFSDKIREASNVSSKEVDYADILGVHRAGYGVYRPDADRLPEMDLLVRPLQSWQALTHPGRPAIPDYSRVLGHRRSRRNFISESISPGRLATFLEPIINAAHAAPPCPSRTALVTGLLAGEGLPIPAGFYILDNHGRRLGQVFSGRLMEAMAAACLDQMWLKNAALHLLFMTDPAFLDRTWGPRGYRYAMIEAGRLGQQAYLAATALGWGVCGVGAIYDREAAQLLGLAAGCALLYLVGAGPVKTR